MMFYYITMLAAFLKSVVDFILPPRRTQRIISALEANDLCLLQQEGRLPYHQEEVSALIWELKYYGSKKAAALAGEFLAEELLAIASEELGPPLLVPVPMHPKRRRERGHNQTELLCEAALRHLVGPEDFPGKIVWPESGNPRYGRPEDFFTGKSSGPYEYVPYALVKIKDTSHQQGLERSKRLRNVQNSMEAASPGKIKGRVCVVVDDVSTTGATLAEAARALKAAGAARVHAVALAQS